MRHSLIPKIVIYFWLMTVFLFIFAPIASMVAFSFNADRFPSLPWAGFSLDWYRDIFSDSAIGAAVYNSAVTATSTSVIATLIGFTSAYADYRYRFPGKKLYLLLVNLSPVIPVVIFGVAVLTFEGEIGLSGSLLGIIVAHVVIAFPFSMVLIRMRLAELDADLEQASWNLGARPWQTLAGIIVPFCGTAILASLAMTMALSFDEFMIAWFVSGMNETLPVRVLGLLQGQVSPRINAIGSVIFFVSTALVLLTNWLIKGRLASSMVGGVK